MRIDLKRKMIIKNNRYRVVVSRFAYRTNKSIIVN